MNDATMTGLTRRFRREWRRSVLVRALARATLALVLVALALLLADRALAVPAALRVHLRWLPLLAFGFPLLPALFRIFPGPDLRRVALLAEERTAGVDQLLVTALELETEDPACAVRDPVARAFARRAQERLGALELRALLPAVSPRALGITAAALGALLLFAILEPGGPPALWAHWSEAPRAVIDRDDGRAGWSAGSRVAGGESGVPPVLGPIRIVVTPPPYAGLPPREVPDPNAVAALPGSRIALHGGDPGRGADVVARVIAAGEPDGRALPARSDDDGWTASWTFAEGERGVSVELFRERPPLPPDAPGAEGAEGREETVRIAETDGAEGADSAGRPGVAELLERTVIPVTTLEDRPPEVELRSPMEDLLLASPEGIVTIGARARDDYGIEELRLSWIHSSGSGESFTFEEGEWEWESVRGSAGEVTAEARIDLSALGLRAGDVLHVRALARDGNVVSGPGEGVSATRLIRVARDDEMADVTTLIGFPIERDRDPLLSQRMIILLTEELLEETPGLDRETVLGRSREIAQEQARLKGRVEEQIFMREAGAMDDPEAHLDHDEEVTPVEEEPERRGEDPAAGYRAMGDLSMLDHAHDSNPILGTDDNLLAAYNAMWEAERNLLIGEANPSLPHQYQALDRLQTLREEDRVYARGRTRTAPVDVAAARGEGDVDDARPADRAAGVALPSAEAWLAEVEALAALAPALGPREVSAQASALAFRMLADPGGSAEAARLLSEAAEQVRTPDRPGEEGRTAARAEALRLLARAAEVLVPDVAGGSAAPVVTPSTPAGARYLRILRGGEDGS